MRKILMFASVVMVLLLLGVALQPAVFAQYDGTKVEEESRGPEEIPGPFRNLKKMVLDLINATPDPQNTYDVDGDGLPDNVEFVIGTDHTRPDSDFDRISDYDEVMNNMDPTEPDSNMDGLPDYYEIDDVDLDIDGDGIPNVWDRDNDGDGVFDGVDMSPFVRSDLRSNFDFSIYTNGGPTYISLQLKTKNPDNMRLINQNFNWPYDKEGSMKDLDNSVEDLVITPLLEFTANQVPEGPGLEEYGIMSCCQTAYIPVFPVWDYGNIVAFKAKIFYPPTGTPGVIDGNMRLSWKVKGLSDNQAMSLGIDEGGFRYVTPGSDGKVYADSEWMDEDATFFWIEQKTGRGAFQTEDGRYLVINGEGHMVASTEPLDNNGYYDLEKLSGSTVLRAHNDKYLRVNPDGSVVADGETIAIDLLTLINRGYVSKSTTLAIYYEDFTITGAIAEEHYGTDAGILYGDNVTHFVAANLRLAYDYLRNGTNSMNDIPDLLDEHEIPLSYNITLFEHKDKAVQALMVDMVHEAMENIDEGDRRPVIMLMEERSASFEMTDINNTSHVLRGDFEMNLTTQPIVTTKSLKSPWYENGSRYPIDMGDIVTDIGTWNVSLDNQAALAGLVLAWSVGENFVAKIGPDIPEYDFPESDEIPFVVDGIMDKGFAAISTLATILKVGKAAYDWVKVNKVSKLFTEPITSIKGISKTYQAVSKVNTGALKVVNRVGDALDIIGLVIDVGIAIYCFFAIADAYDWSAIGVGIAALYAIMMIAYAIVLFAIGMIPVVGWIIALLITLSDLIVGWITGTGWSQRLMEWIIDLVTDFRVRSEVDMEFLGTDVVIHDYDENGLDVGDRIEWISEVSTRVNRTPDGNWGDVLQSYIKPYYSIHVPKSSYSTTYTSSEEIDERFDDNYGWRETDFEIRAWAEPGIGMVNYPVTLTFSADTRVYYDECWWAIVWWCGRTDSTDTVSADPATMYFDVLPASVDDFAKWRGITSNDWDGDGLNNTEEARTSQWKWDTDGDGLGDDYELEIGSIPWLYDSDGDGLNDMTEHLWNSNPRKWDTDGDGLNDYIEHNGWVVSFNYFGKDFHWHINSNPRFNNTDGDAVNDFLEYRTLQNPRSADTDGDGIQDEIRDYYETDFHHIRNMIEGPFSSAIAVDGAGNVYLAINKDGTSLTANCIAKYDKDGVFLKKWDRWEPSGVVNYFSNIVEIMIGPDGDLWVLDVWKGLTKWSKEGAYRNWWLYDGTNPGIRFPFAFDIAENGTLYIADQASNTIRVFDQNRNLLRVIGSPGTGDGQIFNPRALAVHPDGYVFVSDGGHRIQKFAVNGTHIATYKGTVIGNFAYPHDIDVDNNGDLFISEYYLHRIQKVNVDMKWIDTMCEKGSSNGKVVSPINLVITDDNNIYIADRGNYRVQQMWQKVVFVPASSYVVFTDTDGDGFNDTEEAKEWTVTVFNASGSIKFNVTSDPMSPDTDGDGLNDLKEFQLLSNPRSPDTDADGVMDADELARGTNLTHWDSDGDTLDDGIEVTFKSNPLMNDSDQDGLSDAMEWRLGSDPLSRDTDQDGLEDLLEVSFGSNITNPDTDGDLMFDGLEYDLGISPNNPDIDGDGIPDGYEVIFGTDPKNGDSDGDNLLDGFEIGMRINPLSNDTDGDSVLDSTELDIGLNPNSGDSDGDGVPDNLDLDYEVDLNEKVYLAMDEIGNRTRFIEDLSGLVDLQVVEPRAIIDSYKNARYIVLVGDPSSDEGTAGSIIRALLEDTPDLLDRLTTSGEFHITTRYGMWAQTQTIVMLSRPFASDHIRVSGILKSMRMTVGEGAVAATYLNPRSCFMMDDVDTIKQTDTAIWTKLDEMATFSVGITKYTEEDAPHHLDATNGLEPGDEVMGKYVSVEVSESIQTNLTDMVTGSNIKLYYTLDDLDMTGDGDANDSDDLNEETLCLYHLDEETGMWVKVREDLPWVTDAGVNTTDVMLYGTQYAGYIWAEISHFSHFGAGGRPNTFLPTVADAGDDADGFTNQIITFNGTASTGNGELNYTWMFYHRSQQVTLYGPTAEFVFTETGEHVITLLVKDEYNVVDGDTVFITITSMAERMFDLVVGPIIDEHGEPVTDAHVRVSVSNFRFFGESDDEGVALLEMAVAFQDRNIEVFVVKSGYDTLEFDTRITAEGVLSTAPPTMYRELTLVVAHSGFDRIAYTGENTILNGTLSAGNGGIVNYTWSFTHMGEERNLYGPTPVYVFEEEGDCTVTLNVTDFRGLSGEAEMTLTVIERPLDLFTLFVGPVMDQYNLPVVGAQVDLVIGDDEYSGKAMTDGVAYIVLPGAVKGKDVKVRVTGLDIAIIEYYTTITSGGTLETAVPSAQSEAKHPTPGATSEGSAGWLIGVIVALVVVILLAFLIVTKRIGGRKQEPLEETEEEALSEGVEATTDEDIDALLEGVNLEGPSEGEMAEEEVHVIKPPASEEGKDDDTGASAVAFRDLPRSSSRKPATKPVEPKEENVQLTSTEADGEMEATDENVDADI